MKLITAFGGANGLSIRQVGSSYGVFWADKELDRFASYKDAAPLLQDLSISRIAAAGDELIGQLKFCENAFGEGGIVIVVGKAKDGYVVQRQGTRERFEVIADELSDPPTFSF